MNDHDELTRLCREKLTALNAKNELPAPLEQCSDRLNLELAEIKKKEDAWYFLRFYRAITAGRICKIEKNEHNLFVCWVLGICPTVNLNKSPTYTDAELPDIDVDYHPVVRDYLKDDYTPRVFGKDHVCNITSYQTYGVKSSLIDIARVLGEDRDEIMALTTRLGMKDDEDNELTFEVMESHFEKIEEKKRLNKALTKFDKQMQELDEYRKRRPLVWESAKKLVAATSVEWKDKFKYGKPPHRKKSMSMHASGLIVTGVKLAEFVPLVVPPGSRDSGLQSSAWVEGLADTDCSSVGLIKFDYLSLEANAKIAECNRMIMERHGLDAICALPGLPNWSDTSYLNDPKALAMANVADLKGIFQFDSDGIRKMVKKGGVSSFDDLVAYSALYRPGPMDSGMHDEYCDRKNGRSDYEIHPLLQPILGNTYGVIVYQEQCMRVLNVVGDIPLKDCEAVRKAISKKKRDKFEKYEKQFVEVGAKKLGTSTEEVKKIWDQMAAFAEYAFNKSHSCAYTYISARQLWQKAHYPLEFYASALRSLKTGDERIIDYIRDARKHEIPVSRLDLNKSKQNFDINGNTIYYGFGKVLGIGQEVANKVVEGQPYKGFQDFLERFGTEAKVLQPLICLNVFKEKEPLTMYFYYEAYKKALKQKTDRRTRNKKSIARYMNDLQALLGDQKWDYGFDDNHMGKLRSLLDDEKWIKLCTLKKKYDKCVETFAIKDAEEINLSIANFTPRSVKLSKQALKTFKTLKPILMDAEGVKAEEQFYGFPWKNPLERCDNYRGFTFEQFEIDCARLEDGKALPVEVMIESVEKTQSRSGKMEYYKLRVLDGIDVKPRTVRVWEHDYDRFERVFQAGNCVRIRLFPPHEEIPGYNLEGKLPWEMRGRKNPYGENPDFDLRAVLLRAAEKQKKVLVDDDNIFDDIFTEDEEGDDE